MKRETRSEQVMIRIKPSVRKYLNRLAKRSDMTPSTYIDCLITDAIAFDRLARMKAECK